MRGTGAPPVVRKAAVKSDRAARSAAHHALHARHRVRLALPHRSGARLRQPVPVLLGRLQLPAGPRRSRPIASSSWPAPPSPTRQRAGLVSIALCDHPDIERILAGLAEMGYSISPASLRMDDLTPSIVTRLRAERRALADHRARDRLRSAAPRDQQDGHQRGDPRAGRDHLRQRHREPEALLHDRPPDRDRRGSREHPRPDAGDARPHARARPRPRPARPHRRQRQPADPEARHRLPVAADGGDPGNRSQDRPAAQADVGHRQRLLHHQERAALVLPGAALARRSPRRAGDRRRRAQRRPVARRRRRDRRRRRLLHLPRPPRGRAPALGHHRRRHEAGLLPHRVRQVDARRVDAAAEARPREPRS